MRAVATTIAALTAAALASGAAQSARSPRDSAWMLLDASLAGRDDQVVADLRAITNLRPVAQEFPRFADAWIERAPAGERDRRFRVSAFVQLELIRETLERPPAAYDNGRHGIEAYCKRFREFAPTAFEHTWMLASVALLQGARDDRLLAGVGELYQIFPAESHARHAASRFPSEARFELAAVPWALMSVISRMPDDRPQQIMVPAPGVSFKTVPATAILAQTADRLESVPATSPAYQEARLRIGIVRYQLKEFPASLDALRAAARSTDPFVAYLAHLMAGRVHEAAGAELGAIAAYREAVRIKPGAHSGAASLASLLFLTGNREDATAVMNATSGAPAGSDPWRIYGTGDLRFWPAYRASLLAMLRDARSHE